MGQKIKIAGLLILIIGLMYYSITSKESVYILFIVSVLCYFLGRMHEKLNRESRTSGEETGFNSSPPRFSNSPIPTLDDEN